MEHAIMRRIMRLVVTSSVIAIAANVVMVSG